MAAEALEQSVLESKDKDQLLAIAKALGLKASARTKKSDIIDSILETTGTAPAVSAGAPAPLPEPMAVAAVNGDTSHGDASPTATAPRCRPRWPSSTESRRRSGSSTSPPTSCPTPSRPQRPAPWRRTGRPRRAPPPPSWHRAIAGSPTSAVTDGDVPSAHNGVATQTRQPGGEAEGDGESRNRRRRRRRKGNRGADGPQGDDGPVIEQAVEEGVPSNEPVAVSGYLDMRDEGYGFLRVKGYLPSRDDSYIPVKLARQYGLRKGDHITGLSRPAGRNEKNPALLEVHTVNGGDPEAAKRRPRFEDLTALFPDENLRLEDPNDPSNMTARIIDLVSPIGKGQRGIIVSPPKAGKTTVMKTIAKSIEQNNPEVKLIVLLIDERPEEVTDIRRTVQGEVISSTFDRPSDEHTHVAELAIEKAKRLVETGLDVVVILDGITRLSRAYNLAAPASGRILSGGIDAGALYPPKKFFGAARNVEEGGSLTILATALVDTNSRMDEAIFEEFKGTGNMELRLDRRLAERRIYPAIDVDAVEHPPRGAAVRPQAVADGVEAPSCAVGPRR